MSADDPMPPSAAATTEDYTYRRLAAANFVLGVIQRDRPEAIQQLCRRVWKVFGFRDGTYINDETSEVVADWCRALMLGCEAIQTTALILALGDRQGVTPADYENGDYYYIPWKAGESKHAFLIRAEAHFKDMQKADENRGGVLASDQINRKHLEWLVRNRVNKEKHTEIARADGVDRAHVTNAINDAADLLQLPRLSARGRPIGSGHPISPSSPHRRKSSRR